MESSSHSVSTSSDTPMPLANETESGRKVIISEAVGIANPGGSSSAGASGSRGFEGGEMRVAGATDRMGEQDEGDRLGEGEEVKADLPILPWAFIDCGTDELVILIAHMLNRLMAHNDQVPLTHSHLTRFHSRAPPSISVLEYLRRIVRYTNLEKLPLLSLLAYIDTTCLSLPTFTLSSLTVHRFLISGVTAGSKALCDAFCTNGHYAKVGGIRVNELNALEREFLKITEWALCVPAELLQQYYTSLITSHGGYQQAPRPEISPFTTFPLVDEPRRNSEQEDMGWEGESEEDKGKGVRGEGDVQMMVEAVGAGDAAKTEIESGPITSTDKEGEEQLNGDTSMQSSPTEANVMTRTTNGSDSSLATTTACSPEDGQAGAVESAAGIGGGMEMERVMVLPVGEDKMDVEEDQEGGHARSTTNEEKSRRLSAASTSIRRPDPISTRTSSSSSFSAVFHSLPNSRSMASPRMDVDFASVKQSSSQSQSQQVREGGGGGGGRVPFPSASSSGSASGAGSTSASRENFPDNVNGDRTEEEIGAVGRRLRMSLGREVGGNGKEKGVEVEEAQVASGSGSARPEMNDDFGNRSRRSTTGVEDYTLSSQEPQHHQAQRSEQESQQQSTGDRDHEGRKKFGFNLGGLFRSRGKGSRSGSRGEGGGKVKAEEGSGSGSTSTAVAMDVDVVTESDILSAAPRATPRTRASVRQSASSESSSGAVLVSLPHPGSVTPRIRSRSEAAEGESSDGEPESPMTSGGGGAGSAGSTGVEGGSRYKRRGVGVEASMGKDTVGEGMDVGVG